MKKQLSTIILTLLICSAALAANAQIGKAQMGTSVSGIIGGDTTWTKVNSPYTLTGPVAVNMGATLTIEPGTTINLTGHYIQVNGTLIAKGSNNNRINFNSGSILFTVISTGWNEQSNSGNILENVNLDTTSVTSSNALKVSNSHITADISIGSSSIIINNDILGTITVGGSSVISGNTITGQLTTVYYMGMSVPVRYAININGNSSVITNNVILGRINAASVTIIGNTITDNTVGWITVGESSTIRNNYINLTGGIIVGSFSDFSNNTVISDITGDECTISNNIITGGITNHDSAGRIIADSANAISVTGTSVISNNKLTGKEAGSCAIKTTDGNTTISNNIISDFNTGINTASPATIEKNLIIHNQYGIKLGGTTTIQNNTITENTIGINNPLPNSLISYNNIENNNESNIYLITSANIDVTYNWWGTSDTQAINQTIHDFKNDFNLGRANYIPFLSSFNLNAPEIPLKPTPTPTPTSATPTPTPASSAPTSTPTSLPVMPEFSDWTVLLAFAVMATITVLTCINRKLQKAAKSVNEETL